MSNHSTHKRRSRLHFAPRTACVELIEDGTQAVSLEELVGSRCPSLFSKYRPMRMLFNGHLQTVYSVLGDFRKVDELQYDRQLLRLLDGGTLGLDFTPSEASELPKDAPIIIVQHGLTGGSHEPYVRAVLAPALRLGFRAVVVNFRGYLRQALMYITDLYPLAPLLGLGFSIGGNVLVRYLAEEGRNSRISAACILGCPWDIKTNNDSLLHSTIGRHLYLRRMGENVMNIFRQNIDAFRADPDHPTAKAIPEILRIKNPTLTDFDGIFTRSVGDIPPFPFKSVDDYYTWASSHEIAQQIRVPCLTINAQDDPVVQRVQTPKQNEFVVSVLTRSGGHLGWFQRGGRPGARWTTKPVLEWLELFGRHVRLHPPQQTLSTDESGFIRDSEYPSLGCKRVPGGGLLKGHRSKNELLQGL
ncbi:unnamed protein product [Mycena citricolor]|uniref:AB hydrolase-1 domain-containing protein n=1 Tax=Mycena citricolor TaxID=2018698 RepID=A0AAD2H765_9AGAR|nr:unnamed protein product [Mycena citricolor]